MTIKNETAFTKECMEGAMRASNFDNSRYKTFKLIYNIRNDDDKRACS